MNIRFPFAAAGWAMRPTGAGFEVHVRAFIVEATSEDEAHGRAQRIVERDVPARDGWQQHRVAVIRADAEVSQ